MVRPSLLFGMIFIIHSGLSKLYPLAKANITHVQGVSGTIINVLGQAEVTINISGLALVQTFYVLQNLKHAVISYWTTQENRVVV